MRRSKFRSQHWRKVKITTKRQLIRLSEWLTRFAGASASSMMPKWILSASMTWRGKYSCWRKKSSSTNRRASSCKMNLRSHSMCIGGANLNLLILTLMSSFRRFNLCRSAWSPKLKRSTRRTSWFRRRKSCTLNWRTFWRSSVDLRLLRSLCFTNSRWRNVRSSSKRWLLRSSISNLKLRSTSSKLSALMIVCRSARTTTLILDVSKWRWASFQKKTKAMACNSPYKCNSSPWWPNNKCLCNSPSFSLNNSKTCNFRDKQLRHLGHKNSTIPKISQFEN